MTELSAVVQSFYDNWGAGRVSESRALFTDDAVIVSSKGPPTKERRRIRQSEYPHVASQRDMAVETEPCRPSVGILIGRRPLRCW
jgi:ketosteroid isomerase-like protein